MRGFPLLQTALVVLAVLLAGVPVFRLTRPAAAATILAPLAAPADASAPAFTPPVAPLDVEAVFAPAPADFQLKNLDQTVLAGRGPKARFTARWAGSIPADGADLVIQAHWAAAAAGEPGPGPSAARISIRFPDGRNVVKSFWADANGALTDVLSIPASAPASDTP